MSRKRSPKGKTSRREFTEEFKREALRLLETSGKSVAAIELVQVPPVVGARVVDVDVQGIRGDTVLRLHPLDQ